MHTTAKLIRLFVSHFWEKTTSMLTFKMNQWNNSSLRLKLFEKKLLRCSSILAKELLQITAGTVWPLFSCYFFSFLPSIFFCMWCPNCSVLCFLKVSLLVLFILLSPLLFLLPYYLSPLPHQWSICRLELVQQRATKMVKRAASQRCMRKSRHLCSSWGRNGWMKV